MLRQHRRMWASEMDRRALLWDVCVSLRNVDLPASLSYVEDLAFWRSGLDDLNSVRALKLQAIGAKHVPWLRKVSLPFHYRWRLPFDQSWRVADISCGTWNVENMPLLHRLRFLGMRGISGDWASCASSSAWVTSEMAASAGRIGFPALPG
jgi:hypothetical protein